MLAILSGCAASSSETIKAKDEIPAGYTYSPEVKGGQTTVDAAKKDLAVLLGDSSKNPGIKYYGQPHINDFAGKQALEELVKGNPSRSISFWYELDENYREKDLVYMAFSRIAVLENRIEVSPRVVFYYEDMIDQPIVVEKTRDRVGVGNHVVGREIEGGIHRLYKIHFPGLISFHFSKVDDARRFADDLFVIQQALKAKHDERRTLFESKAAQSRALNVKPPVSEEQRRYIVQANALTQQKNYAGAMDLYLKATDRDPVSYPAAYFNMALLYAQELRFKRAIESMNRYLLLEPDAKDARSARDKIYEWELMVPKTMQRN